MNTKNARVNAWVRHLFGDLVFGWLALRSATVPVGPARPSRQGHRRVVLKTVAPPGLGGGAEEGYQSGTVQPRPWRRRWRNDPIQQIIDCSKMTDRGERVRPAWPRMPASTAPCS